MQAGALACLRKDAVVLGCPCIVYDSLVGEAHGPPDEDVQDGAGVQAEQPQGPSHFLEDSCKVGALLHTAGQLKP